MALESQRATRGRGLLEPLLARLRARRAERLIPGALREGRILDVGCGAAAAFLVQTRFGEKHGLDQLAPAQPPAGVAFRRADLHASPVLPYPDAFFAVVTLLAVVEHLRPETVAAVLREGHRVLVPGGRLILTTPAPWSDGLLHVLARLHLVSPEEIDEHVTILTRDDLGRALTRAGFAHVRTGYFEFGLNMWAVAER